MKLRLLTIASPSQMLTVLQASVDGAVLCNQSYHDLWGFACPTRHRQFVVQPVGEALMCPYAHVSSTLALVTQATVNWGSLVLGDQRNGPGDGGRRWATI